MGEQKAIKRYNLNLPEDLFNELQGLADARQTTVVEILRKFIRLGLLAIQVEETPGSELLIKEGEVIKRIILL